MTNEVAKTNSGEPAKTGEGQLAIAANKIANIYLSDVENLNAAVGVPMNDEAKRCGVNAILKLCGDLGAAEVQKLPKEDLVQVIQFVTINGLDVFSGQVFLDKRWDKEKKSYSVKATPMGSAYEIMVKRFGVDVKTVHPAWVIHDGDKFTMPQYEGLKITPPRLEQTLKGLSGKAIAVCYPIEKKSGDAEYVISTREEVAKNLMAQILQNTLSNANISRNELMKKMANMTLDDLLSSDELAPYISPNYRSPASRESMIIAKMKKNALLHYTRDLGSKAYAAVANSVENANNQDMMSKDVVASVDGTEEAEQGTKLNDFTADENGVIPEPASEAKPSLSKAEIDELNKPIKEEPAKESIQAEVVTEKVEPQAQEKPAAEDSGTIDFFMEGLK